MPSPPSALEGVAELVQAWAIAIPAQGIVRTAGIGAVGEEDKDQPISWVYPEGCAGEAIVPHGISAGRLARWAGGALRRLVEAQCSASAHACGAHKLLHHSLGDNLPSIIRPTIQKELSHLGQLCGRGK